MIACADCADYGFGYGFGGIFALFLVLHFGFFLHVIFMKCELTLRTAKRSLHLIGLAFDIIALFAATFEVADASDCRLRAVVLPFLGQIGID